MKLNEARQWVYTAINNSPFCEEGTEALQLISFELERIEAMKDVIMLQARIIRKLSFSGETEESEKLKEQLPRLMERAGLDKGILR